MRLIIELKNTCVFINADEQAKFVKALQEQLKDEDCDVLESIDNVIYLALESINLFTNGPHLEAKKVVIEA